MENHIEKLKAIIVSNIAKQKQDEVEKKDAEKIGKGREKAEKRARIALKDAQNQKTKAWRKIEKIKTRKKTFREKDNGVAEMKDDLDKTKSKL